MEDLISQVLIQDNEFLAFNKNPRKMVPLKPSPVRVLHICYSQIVTKTTIPSPFLPGSRVSSTPSRDGSSLSANRVPSSHPCHFPFHLAHVLPQHRPGLVPRRQPAPQSRYSPFLGDGARLLRGGSGSGSRRGRRRGSPRFALIGTHSLLGPAQQMTGENPEPPPGTVSIRVRVSVPVRCRTAACAHARPARYSRRLRHGFRLVPPPGTAGRG